MARVPATAKLKPVRRVPWSRCSAERLSASGDYTGVAVTGDAHYSVELQESVPALSAPSWPDRRRGCVGGDDRGDERANRAAHQPIALNLERCLASAGTSASGTFSHIPEYRLEVWDRNRCLSPCASPVGKKTRRPDLRRRDDLVVFSPSGTWPPDIAQGETFRKCLKDPGFLERSKIEVVDTAGTPIDPSLRSRRFRANTGFDSGPARTTRSGS